MWRILSAPLWGFGVPLTDHQGYAALFLPPNPQDLTIPPKRLPAVKLSNGYWKVKKDDLERFLRARYEIRKRIIVFSDDSATSQLVQNIAAANDIDVAACTNLADAMLKANELQPSLVVIDIDVESGWDLVCRLQSMRRIVKIPILAIVSGALSEQRLEKALEFGIRGCLLKPVTAENLEHEILAATDGHVHK